MNDQSPSMCAAGPTLLRLQNVEAAYGPTQVLWGVSLSVKTGQIACLVGSNGAGKSTTLNTIAGILKAKHGRILVNDHDLTNEPPRQRVQQRITLVPEARQLWPKMTVEDNLLMGAFPSQFRKSATTKLAHVYEMFPRLKERRHQLAGTLSGGEQQMCAIGRGLMPEPELLMLDEPTLGLAPKAVDEIFQFITNISREGVTILLVAQNVNYALRFSQYAYLMETGRITLEGASESLLTNPYIQEAYLGSA